jgi:hypothetical protein
MFCFWECYVQIVGSVVDVGLAKGDPVCCFVCAVTCSIGLHACSWLLLR